MHRYENGGRRPTLVEQKVIAQEFMVEWQKPRIDTSEMVRLVKKGWSEEKLSKHFHKPQRAIYRLLWDLKRKGRIK